MQRVCIVCSQMHRGVRDSDRGPFWLKAPVLSLPACLGSQPTRLLPTHHYPFILIIGIIPAPRATTVGSHSRSAAIGPTHGALWRPSVRAPRSFAVGWVPTRGRLGLARAPRPASRGRKRAAHMRIACMPHARSPFTRESLVTVEGPLGSHWGPPPLGPPRGDHAPASSTTC